MTRFDRAAAAIESALEAGDFSAAAVEVGGPSEPAWAYARGRLSFEATAPEVDHDTVFDLASLTKVLATTPIALTLVTSARLRLNAPVSALLPVWRGHDRAGVTVRDLLEHCSGLPAHRPYYESMSGRQAFEAAIAEEPLEYEPRTRSIYSDLGFILLGFLLEDAGEAALDAQFEAWRRARRIDGLVGFAPTAEAIARTASTGFDAWRDRNLQGEVHDGNAAALGGVAAHAGLFGTAGAVGEIARWWLQRESRDSAGAGVDDASFTCRSTVAGSSRALGWDTMLVSSSCGTRMSARAFGHTGFTGTSIWIDPGHDVYAVLLTNFVCSGRDRARLRALRRGFHDAVMQDLGCEPT